MITLGGSPGVFSLTVLCAPEIQDAGEIPRWLRRVGIGTRQLLQEIASGRPDRQLQNAAAWLATDLGTITEAVAAYLENGVFKVSEDSCDAERCEEIARLLGVGTEALGDSEERRFVVAGIAERLKREWAALDRGEDR